MPQFLPTSIRPDARLMVFVDGENLAIRYKSMLGQAAAPTHVRLEPDVWVWSTYLHIHNRRVEVVRQYYFTSVPGDAPRRKAVEDALRDAGIEAPRVFTKERNKRTKRVDISLATEMLTHAHRGNYDVAVLVAGDSDYVPLVDAVMAEGKRVVLWFVPDGLSEDLKARVDYFWDMTEALMAHDTQLLGMVLNGV